MVTQFLTPHRSVIILKVSYRLFRAQIYQLSRASGVGTPLIAKENEPNHFLFGIGTAGWLHFLIALSLFRHETGRKSSYSKGVASWTARWSQTQVISYFNLTQVVLPARLTLTLRISLLLQFTSLLLSSCHLSNSLQFPDLFPNFPTGST